MNKLLWAKDPESGRKLRDVRAIMVAGPIDVDERFAGWIERLGLRDTWTPPQRDTTTEALLLQRRVWMSLTGEERLRLWRERTVAWDQVRLERLRNAHPGADDITLGRLWFEEPYQGEFTAEYLDRVEAWMRTVEDREERQRSAVTSGGCGAIRVAGRQAPFRPLWDAFPWRGGETEGRG